MIAFACGVLEQYRENPDDRNEGWPAPTPQNTKLRDDTGEFAMSEFFYRGTLDAYMDDAE